MIARTCLHLAVVASLAPAAFSQLSQSANFRLDDLALGGGGGGASSLNFASFFGLHAPAAGRMSSPNFEAGVGFLESWDPHPTNAPVVFGVAPFYGTKAGGTAVTISGLNFDKFGAAPTITAQIAGAPVSALNVSSDTQLSCVTPAGPPGPNDVVVTSLHGSGALAGGFIHTPAITIAPLGIAIGTSGEMVNYGEPGSGFDIYFSDRTTQIPIPPFGELLIGPFPLVLFISGNSYAPGSGIAVQPLPIPNNPQLLGLTLYFQSFSIFHAQLTLTNRATLLLTTP